MTLVALLRGMLWAFEYNAATWSCDKLPTDSSLHFWHLKCPSKRNDTEVTAQEMIWVSAHTAWTGLHGYDKKNISHESQVSWEWIISTWFLLHILWHSRHQVSQNVKVSAWFTIWIATFLQVSQATDCTGGFVPLTDQPAIMCRNRRLLHGSCDKVWYHFVSARSDSLQQFPHPLTWENSNRAESTTGPVAYMPFDWTWHPLMRL